MRCEDGSDSAGDLVLDTENILKLTIIALGPEMRSGGGINQLCSDAHAVARRMLPSNT